MSTSGMLEGGGAGGAAAPPDFGRSEGAAGQRRRAALLPAPQIFRLCNMPVLRWVSKLGVLVCE